MKKYIVLLIIFNLSMYPSQDQFKSQYAQDQFAYESFFKDKNDGVFVDIGAHNGITLSNSYFFEKVLGWWGICVEPLPAVFDQLNQNRDCVCLNCCVANFSGTSEFLQISGYSEMLSGLVDSYDSRHLKRIENELKSRGGFSEKIQVESRKLQDIVDEYQISKIDFLSIDTEGSELEILRSINFDNVFIDVITIENNYSDDRIYQFLTKKGFMLVKKLGADEVYKNGNPAPQSISQISRLLK